METKVQVFNQNLERREVMPVLTSMEIGSQEVFPACQIMSVRSIISANQHVYFPAKWKTKIKDHTLIVTRTN